MIVWMVQEESSGGEYFRLRWDGKEFVAEVFNETSTEWKKYVWDISDQQFLDGKLDTLVVEIDYGELDYGE